MSDVDADGSVGGGNSDGVEVEAVKMFGSFSGSGGMIMAERVDQDVT